MTQNRCGSKDTVAELEGDKGCDIREMACIYEGEGVWNPAR